MNSKLGIYISSYDGCKDLWDTFFLIIDRYWPDNMYPIYLINNEEDYEHSEVKVVHTGPEVHWRHRSIMSLKQVKEEYILFMLEDYFLSKHVINNDIDEIIRFMDSKDAFYYQLSVGNTKPTGEIRINVTADTNYPISLQPAIWRRESLIELLERIHGNSPWDVENDFQKSYQRGTGNIPGAYHDTRDILGYKNGVLRGKWITNTVQFYREQGITIDTSDRGEMSRASMIKYAMAGFVHKRMPKKVKKIMKSFLKMINYDYMKY